MMRDRRPESSPAERLADEALVILGLVAALLAAPALVGLVLLLQGGAAVLAAVSVYAATLVAMFAASAGYHLVPSGARTDALRRIDHGAIYAKLAGTYTPFAVLHGDERTLAILAGIWAAAAVGIALKLLAPRRFKTVTLALYLVMGWAVVIVGWPILTALAPVSVGLILAGGALYTLGVGVFVRAELAFQNAVWHGLVLVATALLYAAVLLEVRAALSPWPA